MATTNPPTGVRALRSKPRLLLAFMLVTAPLLAGGSPSRADMPAAEQARRAQVVAHVGPRAITLGELEDRIAEVPRYQLAAFGATPDAVRHKFLQDIVVQEILWAQGAEANKLDRELVTSHAVERALSSATIRAIRSQIGTAADVSMDEVKAYYEANKSSYDSPERIGIWRILCKTRDEAQTVLDAVKKDPTPKNFQDLARDHSLDRATYLRGGNVGFVGPDGTSNEVGLKVEPVIVQAAARVKDGELVPSPVEEAGSWAVVWRRGTVGASRRSVEDSAAQIRDTVWKQKVETATRKLIADLRAAKVRDLNEELLQSIDVAPKDGTVVPRKRPGQVPPITAPGAGSRR